MKHKLFSVQVLTIKNELYGLQTYMLTRVNNSLRKTHSSYRESAKIERANNLQLQGSLVFYGFVMIRGNL